MIEYHILSVWVIACSFAATFAQLNVSDGILCETRMYKQEFVKDRSKYYACKTQISQQKLGVWKLISCSPGKEFVMLNQTCESKKRIRRQQQWVGPQQHPCYVSPGQPQVGQNCNWATSGLQQIPNSAQQFYQCAQQQTGAQCGQWQQMGCPTDTQFNQQLQICVTNAAQNSCPQQQTAVCPCQQQQQQQTQCPPTTVCIQATCCQQQQPVYTPPPTWATPPPMQQCCCCFMATTCPNQCQQQQSQQKRLAYNSNDGVSSFESAHQKTLLADKTSRNNNKQFTLVLNKQKEDDDAEHVNENSRETMDEKQSEEIR